MGGYFSGSEIRSRAMSPVTHLFASWIVAAKTTDNARDCRLVTLAGVLPDVDGFGLVADMASGALAQGNAPYYQRYHHFVLHGLFGAFVITVMLTAFARRRVRVALLALAVFHLHLLCDLAGSRGPAPEDLWPIFYFGPFDKDPMWIWKGQWPLDSWRNRLLTVILFFWSLWLAVSLGHSFVGVFNRKADQIFVTVLRKSKSSLFSNARRGLPDG
jgi:ABC-type cobalamin transport system permease subunit